jgi:hypothetical protein
MFAHHAYYIEGSPGDFERYKKDIPHFVAQKYERFGVDEARALTQMASLKNISRETVFLIALSSITTEAQQALLKLFEEPQKGTVFVVLAPHGALVATLKSRMLEYEKQSPAQKKVLGFSVSAKTQEAGRPDHFSAPAIAFLRVSGKERSDFITKMLKDDEDAKERVRDFVNALEFVLSKNIKKNKDALGDIAVARDYLGDRAPSLKMLLEHLALSLPTV